MKISLFSESFTREKEGAFCTRSKKANTFYLAESQKGGEVRYHTRAKKCPTESRRIPSSATRTRSSRRNRYVFSSFNFVVFARLTTKCILYLLIPHTQKNFCQSECFFERVFRPLLVTQLFHTRGRKKREKIFSLFWVCKQKPRRRFFDTSKFIRSADLCIIYNIYSLLPF